MSSLAMREWRSYKPHIEVHAENKDYVVKTAASWREWYAVLKFRKQIFLAEYEVASNFTFGLDLDRFDWKCDHLIVTTKDRGQVVGCYRLMSSLHNEKFYSEGEFEIGSVKRMPGIKVELGRACVHPAFRNGSVIQLLWRGIAEYVKATQAEYAFGCTSVKTTDPLTARRIELYLQEKEAYATWPHVMPRPEYQFRASEKREQSRILMLEDSCRSEVTGQIPPLLKSYLRLGAKFCGPAAIDRKFSCLDFFTLFDFTRLSQKMRDKYEIA
jgi:putative hemolysin